MGTLKIIHEKDHSNLFVDIEREFYLLRQGSPSLKEVTAFLRSIEENAPKLLYLDEWTSILREHDAMTVKYKELSGKRYRRGTAIISILKGAKNRFEDLYSGKISEDRIASVLKDLTQILEKE